MWETWLPFPLSSAAPAVMFLHFAYSPLLFLWFAVSQVAATCTLANFRATPKPYRRAMFIWAQLALIACYVGEAAVLILRSVIEPNWWCGKHNVMYVLPAILAWSAVTILLYENPNPAWVPYYGCWFLTGIIEAILLATADFSSGPFDVARLIMQMTRIGLLVAFSLCAVAMRGRDDLLAPDMEERAGLLGVKVSKGVQNYGAIVDTDDLDADTDSPGSAPAKSKMLEKLEKSGNWVQYLKSFRIFLPYIWPTRDRLLMVNMILVGVCLLVVRAIRVLVPYQTGVVVTLLTKNPSSAPWKAVSLLILYRWLDSGSGITWIKSYLWMPVEQYSYRTITTEAYNHVMSLSSDFHANKKTGELWAAIGQGRSVSNLLNMLLFNLLPMLADMVIAFTYFLFFFNSYMALVVAVVCISYLWATARLSSMTNKVRRDINETSRHETQVMVETVGSWSTVSYFNRVGYEQNRYLEAIKMFQTAERRWTLGLSMVSVVQSLIFTVGLLFASFIAVYDISTGERQAGSFVMLLTYWVQLNGPLQFFSQLHRGLMDKVLDAERLLELFQTKPTVTDLPGAQSLDEIKGDIVFDKVNFCYDPRKPVLQDLSFRVPAGTTVALVGETGGGKSTCMKLLFRFYDVMSGSIRVDGHDIRDVKLESLRNHMGVVPQDPELFNDTIMYNLKYAKLEATDDEVYAACRAASIHDKIMNFPDGYNSMVGERGVRLSGGELQRVAIARAILRNPKIILLDEATSMIDVGTERDIQSALNELAKNRTMFVIAHRLSTIMNADLIVVVQDGQMLESGSHADLMAAQGKYYNLWTNQSTNDTSGVSSELSPEAQNIMDDIKMPNNLTPVLTPKVLPPAMTPQLSSSGQPLAPTLPSDISLQPVRRNTIAHMPGRFMQAPDGLLTPSASSDSLRTLDMSRSMQTPKTGFKPDAKEFVPRAATMSSMPKSLAQAPTNFAPYSATLSSVPKVMNTIPSMNKAAVQIPTPTPQAQMYYTYPFPGAAFHPTYQFPMVHVPQMMPQPPALAPSRSASGKVRDSRKVLDEAIRRLSPRQESKDIQKSENRQEPTIPSKASGEAPADFAETNKTKRRRAQSRSHGTNPTDTATTVVHAPQPDGPRPAAQSAGQESTPIAGIQAPRRRYRSAASNRPSNTENVPASSQIPLPQSENVSKPSIPKSVTSDGPDPKPASSNSATLKPATMNTISQKTVAPNTVTPITNVIPANSGASKSSSPKTTTTKQETGTLKPVISKPTTSKPETQNPETTKPSATNESTAKSTTLAPTTLNPAPSKLATMENITNSAPTSNQTQQSAKSSISKNTSAAPKTGDSQRNNTRGRYWHRRPAAKAGLPKPSGENVAPSA